MNLDKAKAIASKVLMMIEPFADHIEVVGSIRREKKDVNDIDILMIPKSSTLFELMSKLVSLGAKDMRAMDHKTIKVDGITAELWFTTEQMWPVILLVRTGSEKHNKRMAELCKSKGLSLSVSKGAILGGNGKKIPIEKEEDVFTVLEIPYKEPHERE